MGSRPVRCRSAVARRLHAMQYMLEGFKNWFVFTSNGLRKGFLKLQPEISYGVKIYIIHAETFWRSSSVRH